MFAIAVDNESKCGALEVRRYKVNLLSQFFGEAKGQKIDLG